MFLLLFYRYIDVFVDILDVNDNAPSFGPYPEVVDMNEDAPVGSLVLQLTVTDADASSVITFSMVSVERRGRRQTDTFTVNATGAVLTNGPLDADTQDTYVEFALDHATHTHTHTQTHKHTLTHSHTHIHIYIHTRTHTHTHTHTHTLAGTHSLCRRATDSTRQRPLSQWQ